MSEREREKERDKERGKRQKGIGQRERGKREKRYTGINQMGGRNR